MCCQGLMKSSRWRWGTQGPGSHLLLTTMHLLEYLSAISISCLQNLEMMNPEGFKNINLPLLTLSMSEDCLYLNIYTPAHAREGSNLPVSVRTWSAWERACFSR